MPNNPTGAEVSEITVKALKLRPGMALQVQGASQGAQAQEAQFLAAVESKGVMVGPHATAGGKLSVREGEGYIVRGFTGQYDFRFFTNVIQTYEKPFVYALMVYPEFVEARLVRSAMRMKTSLPATVSLPGGSSFVNVTLVDVSVAGAMVNAPTSLGVVGDELNLGFSVEFEKNPVNMTLRAAICHSNKVESGEGFNIGLIFKSVSQQEKLVLHYMTRESSG